MRKIRTKMVWFALAFVLIAALGMFGMVMLVGGSDRIGIAAAD